jgi:GT2 family glycosyltransferase
MEELATTHHKTLAILNKKDIPQLNQVSTIPNLIFLQNDSNEGFAAANNIMLELLRNTDSYIWLLNPDMIVTKTTLSELLTDAFKKPRNTVIGTLTKSYAEKNQILFLGGGEINFATATVRMIRNKKNIDRLDYISGSSLFTHASNFLEVGLLPEDYFLYWEETDWCQQAISHGVKLTVCSSAICYDKISTTIGKKFVADYYYTRNGLRFISKYRKRNIPVVLLFMAIRFLKRIFMGRWQSAGGVYQGVIDFFKTDSYEIQ